MGGMFCWRCEEIRLSLLRCNKSLLQPVLEDPAAVLNLSADGRQRTLWVGVFPSSQGLVQCVLSQVLAAEILVLIGMLGVTPHTYQAAQHL